MIAFSGVMDTQVSEEDMYGEQRGMQAIRGCEGREESS